MRVVLCDFGGVLTNPLIEAFTGYQDESGISMEALGTAMAKVFERDGRHPLFELEKGLITEHQFLESLRWALTQELGEGTEVKSFTDTYFSHLHVNQPMIDYLMELKQRGLRLAMVTNNVREWEPRWRPMLPVDEIFELVIDSAFVGARKPEPEIFQITLERLRELDGLADVTPIECVLIDDIAVNCEGAEAVGIQAVLFHSAQQVRSEIEGLLNK